MKRIACALLLLLAVPAAAETRTQAARRIADLTASLRAASEARAQAEKSRSETETARAYLESVLGNLSIGGQQNKLDVQENGLAIIRAHDLAFGHSGRRGQPGRALVDNKEALILNYGADWSRTDIHGPVVFGGAVTIHAPSGLGRTS